MKAESIFLKEWLATDKSPSQLPISAVCNSRCIFCSNQLNPFPITRNIFRDLEDIKLQLTLMPPQYTGPIRLSDSLPGRIAEGEAFLHPQFFKIIELVRRRFISNLLCFTTNGSMLDESFLKELARFRPIELAVAIHSTRPELLARIFSMNERAAGGSIRSLELISKYHFQLIGVMVILPAICGWNDIERSYANFVRHGARSMILWWPGYTIRTPGKIVQELKCPLAAFTDFAERMRKTHKIPLLPHPDMAAALDLPLSKIMALTLQGNIRNGAGPYRRVLWLTSEAAAERLAAGIAKQASAFPNQHDVFPVKNLTYGGNIFCAGLLMVADFIAAGKEALARRPDTELILIPDMPFDSLLMDLSGRPAYQIAEQLAKCAWVVGGAGSFNSLLGRGFLKTADSRLDQVKRTMKIFNSAWAPGADPGKSLECVRSFPLRTSAGSLSRARYRRLILQERLRRPARREPIGQRFEFLDNDHALCLETWPTRDAAVTSNKWVFLVKNGKDWKIERTMDASADALASPAGR